MTERDKVTVDNIIGLVHTDEPTDSVEEVRKLRGRTNERFIVDTAGTLIDMETRNTYDYVSEVVGLLNGYDKENEQLKKQREELFIRERVTKNEWRTLKKENKKQLTALKNLCEVEICEICEHQQYLTYETQDCIEYDSRCKKGFKEYNGKFYGIETLECDDFELRKELQRDD